MARLEISEDKLIIKLNILEKILAVRKSDIEIPLECVEKIKIFRNLDESEINFILPRYRILGFSLGNIVYGIFKTDLGKGFFLTRNLENSTVIIMKEGCKTPYKIIVIDISDTQRLQHLLENPSSKLQFFSKFSQKGMIKGKH